MTAARRLLPLLGLALLLPSPAPAEETPAPAVDAAAAAGEAATAEGQGRYADAAKAWRRAADAGGAGAADAWAGLARVLEATGRIPEALDAARKAAELAPKAIDSLVLLGRIQAASGDPEGAVKVLAEAAASAANRALPSKALGDVLRATGRRKEALERYAAANAAWASGATDDPADLVAVVEARFSIMELDPNPGYREQFQSTLDILAVPLKAGLPAAIVAEAEFYARHDQTERVPKALRPLLTRNPNHPDALVVAARAKERRFESDEAAALARRALAVDPTHPGAVEVLALLRYGDGAREEAVATVRRALAARPRLAGRRPC